MNSKSTRLRTLWKHSVSLILYLCLSTVAFSQTHTISGRVTNENNEPLPGVSVQVKGTDLGTTTDKDGNYSIAVPAQASLLFSFIGYDNRELPVDNRPTINVVLHANVALLKETVVIGYGKESRENVTTSVSKMDSKVLKSVPYANPMSALEGTMAGVMVQSATGQPGAAPTVVIRGGTSINNPGGANPLYIVDGVIRPQLDNIASDDIESIQVLKDAASTAIYGARGSNGVVIVTTKSGTAGQTRVTYSYDLTLSKVGKQFKMANVKEFLTAQRLSGFQPAKFADASDRLTLPDGYGTGNDLTNQTAFTLMYLTDANKYKLNEGWESMPDPADPSKTLLFKGTNFSDIIFQTGVSHNHHIDISGGSDKATFNAGIGYLQNEGTVLTTGYKRLSFNLNGTLKVNDDLNFFARVMYSKSQENDPTLNYESLFYRSSGLAPTAKFRYEDGTLAPGTNSSIGNPLYYLSKFIDKGVDDNLTMIAGGHWEILPGLSFDPQVSMYNVYNNSYSFQPAYYNGPLSYVDSRNANATNYRWIQDQIDAVFKYDKTFSDVHHLNVTAGFSYYGREVDNFTAAGKGASTDIVPTLNAASTPTSISSSISNQLILSYFGRAQYDYRQKYLLSLTARYDGATNLGAANRWGFFPGVSAGWNIHKENFWHVNPNFLSSVKIRGSYGETGNISGLSDFQSQGAYSVGYLYNGNAGIINTTMANQDLKWEHSKTLDIGADIGAVNGRLSIIADFYRRVTDNLLTSLSLPPSTGFSSSITNLGSLENKGFEVEVSANILPPSSALQWNISVNAAYTKNKILKLPPNGVLKNRIGGNYVWDTKSGTYEWKGGLQEGGRIGDMYSLKQVGIYATDQDAASAPIDMYIADNDKTVYGGDTKWLDNDRNDTIDSRDFVYMGNQYPDMTGGFSTTLSYKNFSLYARFDYTLGHTIFDYAALFLDMNGYSDGNLTQKKYDESWKKQGDNAKMSRYYWGGERVQRNNFLGVTDIGNSIYYESGNFLCLREITLSYAIPENILKKLRMSSLQFHVSGNNIHYFTNYYGLNPEVGGKDDGRYPMPKNIVVGATVSF